MTGASSPAGSGQRDALTTAMGLATAATALGLARFGYTVLLPAMRADLGWSYATAGGLNTANALGYLLGALASPLLLRRWAPAGALRWTAAVTAASLLACATTADPVRLGALRTVGGAAAAVLFVAGGLLAAQLADTATRPGAVLGIFYAGVGPGLLLSTLLAPTILTEPANWRAGWLLLGGLATACAATAVTSTRRIPPVTVHTARGDANAAGADLRWAAVAFGLFGLGYIPFMTFVVAYWRDSGSTITVVTLLWSLLAATATVSGWLLRRWLDEPTRGLIKLLALVTVAATLPLLSTRLVPLGLSSALFGAGFLTVTAAITQLIREGRNPQQRHHTLSAFTAIFAAGQVVGPVLTGWLADHLGLRGGLAVAAGFLALATLAARAQRARIAGSRQLTTPRSIPPTPSRRRTVRGASRASR